MTAVDPLHQHRVEQEVRGRRLAQPRADHARCWRVLRFRLFLFCSFPLLSATYCRMLLLCFGFLCQRAAFAESAEARKDDRLQGILAVKPGVLLGARRTRRLLRHNPRTFKIWAVANLLEKKLASYPKGMVGCNLELSEQSCAIYRSAVCVFRVHTSRLMRKN